MCTLLTTIYLMFLLLFFCVTNRASTHASLEDLLLDGLYEWLRGEGEDRGGGQQGV